MHSLSTPFDRPFRVVLGFHRPDASNTRIAAIVVWRSALGPRPVRWRDALRRLRYKLALDPLHARVYIGSDAGLWLGSAGPLGEQETLFHARRRVVRVQGREFEVPHDGPPTILLVDEAQRARESLSVVQCVARALLPARPFLRTSVMLTTDPESSPFTDAWQRRAWEEFLAGEPTVRAFMNVNRTGQAEEAP